MGGIIMTEGTFKQNKEPKIEDTATDVYYKTERKIEDSKVAIPTHDSVEEAKKWVDDENRK
jgi:predicted transposase YbfD/YdcC